MGIDLSFYLEYFDGHAWVPAVHVADLVDDRERRLGVVRVCWWPARRRDTQLFFGSHAVIPLNPGLPADVSPAVYNCVSVNFEHDARYAASIPLAEMFIDDWETEKVTVVGWVEARYAGLFSDGQQEFPAQALMDSGFQDKKADVLRWTGALSSDVHSFYPHDRFRHAEDVRVPITWVESLAAYASTVWGDGLCQLVGIPNQGAYRIITGMS